MRSPKPRDPFRVVAIVSAYNEADIISPVIGHLVENGVDVYLIDNRSTDATVEGARAWLGRGLLKIEEFPEKPPRGKKPPPFDWGAILKRKEELAGELRADWFIHHDADEFREAPWPGMNLRDAIRWVDRLGYNCIDFRVLNFPPVDDGFRLGADPREHFTQWEEPIVHDTVQRKCWKNTGAPVSLAVSGGHEARFRGRRVFPIQFLLRHYPIRSQEHGRRKVFEERKNRFLERERAKGWHVQYDRIEDETHSFLGNPASLQPYDADQVRLDLILRNKVTREAEERAQAVLSSLSAREQELANLQSIRANLERHAGQIEGGHAELERHAKALEKERERLTRLLGNLESGRGELERYAKNLEKEQGKLTERLQSLEAALADRERHAKNLESGRGELERYAKNLEDARESLTREIGELRRSLADRERHAANLESSRAAAQDFAKNVVAERDDLALRVAELGRSVRDREEQGRNLETSRAELERYAKNLEKEQERLGKLIAKLETERAERERHVASVESARKEIERHVGSLQSFLAQRDREIASLEGMRAESERYAKSLEVARTELERSALVQAKKLDAHARDLESRLASALERARNLDSARSDLERRNRSLAEELEAIRNSTTWRWSAPLRRLMDALRAAAR